MAKLRHIAINVSDAEKAAQFFENAFGMKRVGTGGRSVHVADGVMNIALLHIRNAGDPVGLAHFGIWVDEFASAEKKVLGAGAVCLQGRPADNHGFYEAKYRDPDGIVFDLTPADGREQRRTLGPLIPSCAGIRLRDRDRSVLARRPFPDRRKALPYPSTRSHSR